MPSSPISISHRLFRCRYSTSNFYSLMFMQEISTRVVCVNGKRPRIHFVFYFISKKIGNPSNVLNPFTARVFNGVLQGDSNFESVDQILWCNHSNESSRPVLTHGDSCLSKFYEMKFGNLVEICLWTHLAVKGLNNKSHKVLPEN